MAHLNVQYIGRSGLYIPLLSLVCRYAQCCFTILYLVRLSWSVEPWGCSRLAQLSFFYLSAAYSGTFTDYLCTWFKPDMQGGDILL